MGDGDWAPDVGDFPKKRELIKKLESEMEGILQGTLGQPEKKLAEQLTKVVSFHVEDDRKKKTQCFWKVMDDLLDCEMSVDPNRWALQLAQLIKNGKPRFVNIYFVL